MQRWTSSEDDNYNKMVFILSNLQHLAFDHKYHSYNNFKFMFWDMVETIAFKLKMYFYGRDNV